MAGSPLRRPRFRPWSNRSRRSVGSRLGRTGCCGTIPCPGLALAVGHPHPRRRGCRRRPSRASPRPQLIDRPGAAVRGGRRCGPDRHARANDGSDRCRTVSRLRPSARIRQPDPHRPPDTSSYRRKDRQPHAFSNADDRWARLDGGCRASIGRCFLRVGSSQGGFGRRLQPCPGPIPRGVAATSVMFGLTAPLTGAIVAAPRCLPDGAMLFSRNRMMTADPETICFTVDVRVGAPWDAAECSRPIRWPRGAYDVLL